MTHRRPPCLHLLCLVVILTIAVAFPSTPHLIRQSECPSVLPAAPEPRIVGGQPAPPAIAVFLAALFAPGNRFKCSATIIAPGWLLTARHCNASTSWTAILATADRLLGTHLAISAVIPHPSTGERHDLTLIRLASIPTLRSDLPLLNNDIHAPKTGSYVRAAGYGRRSFDDSSNTRLRQVDLPVVSQRVCNEAYGSNIVDTRICAGFDAGGCDSCLGDSGGPLIQYDSTMRPIILAVVSAGKKCALPGFPGLYAPVQPVLAWLREEGVSFDSASPDDSATTARASPSVSMTPTPSIMESITPTMTPISQAAISVTPIESPLSQISISPTPTQTSSSQPAVIPAASASASALALDGSGGGGGGEGVSSTAVPLASSATTTPGGGGDMVSVGTDGTNTSSDSGSGSDETGDDDRPINASGESTGTTISQPSATISAGTEQPVNQAASSGLSSGAVAGIAVAGVAVALVLVVASICYVMMPRSTDGAAAV